MLLYITFVPLFAFIMFNLSTIIADLFVFTYRTPIRQCKREENVNIKVKSALTQVFISINFIIMLSFG